MNLGQLTDAAIAQVVGVTNTERLVNAAPEFVQAMINKGYHIIERAALWKFSEKESDLQVQVGQRVAQNLPSDLGVPLMVYSNRTGNLLQYHDERQRFFPLQDKGPVHAYGMWGDELRFYPLPTQAETVTLRYYAKWADLTDPSDTPVFPETFHDLLMDYGSYHLALRLPPTGDRFLPNSAAQPYADSFEVGLARMKDSDLTMKTFDEVPNYDFHEHVLGIGEW